MKRLYSLLLSIILSLSYAASARDFTYTYEGQTLTYTVLDEEAKTCQTKAGEILTSPGNNIEGVLSIPGKIKDPAGIEFTVVAIGTSSFYDNEALTSINIPETVLTIGIEAFGECYNLTSINLPKSLTRIEGYAFRNCFSLSEVHLSDIVNWCKTNVLGDTSSPFLYGAKLYVNDDLVEDLIIPEEVLEVLPFSFYGCSSIKSLDFSESVTTIGLYSFKDCYNLKKVRINPSVKKVDISAFAECRSLSEVFIENLSAWCEIEFGRDGNPLENGASLYLNNERVSHMEIPSTVHKVGSYAFSGFTSLESVTLSPNVTEISDYAFNNCSNLQTLTIGSGLKTIRKYAFYECFNLHTIICEALIPPTITGTSFLSFEDAVLFVPSQCLDHYKDADVWKNFGKIDIIGSSTWTPEEFSFGELVYRTTSERECQVVGGHGGYDSFTIPEKVNYNGKDFIVTSISSNAFFKNREIQNIIIPNTVEYIGAGAFKDCSSLSFIEFPNSIKRVEGEIFMNCTSLTYIKLSDAISYIGPGAFNNCINLSKITLPPTLVRIEPYTFYACESITTIEIPESIKSIGEYAFLGSSIDTVNIQSLESWCKIDFDSNSNPLAACWSFGGAKLFLNGRILKELRIPEGIDIIKSNSFMYCSSLEKLLFPNSVIEIKDYAFQGCANLQSISFSENLKTIEIGAFAYCYSLNNLPLPNSLETIEWGAFTQCSSLTTVSIPKNVSKIGRSAFSSCTSLASITFPESLSVIESSAFADCSSLSSINLPKTLTTIADRTFMGCSSLSSVIIPESVTNIGMGAFAYCSALKSVTFPKKVSEIGKMAFLDCFSLSSITCCAVIPPIADSGSFTRYDGVKLTVPAESVEKYRMTDPWSRFTIGAKPSGIEGVEGESVAVTVDGGDIVVSGDGRAEVYSLTGVRVATVTGGRVSGLPRGIYLVRVAGKTVKVVL